MEITGYKDGSQLVFRREGKQMIFDFKDMSFYRPLKRGDLRKVENGQNFFRKVSVSDIAEGFKDEAYGKLIKLVNSARYSRRATNFATIFESIEKYKHLESYLLLKIPFTGTGTFTKPVSIYPKAVLRFMKESRVTFVNNYWEQNFLRHPRLFEKLCAHVLRNHYLDLEVYRMLFKMLSGYYSDFDKFNKLVSSQAKEVEFTRDYWNNNRMTPKETPFGCEYKTLFSYLVMIDRTEALDFDDALTIYYDYLRMMRTIERNKALAKLRAVNPELDETTVGWVNFAKIEKYPKYLQTRHDVVTRNFNNWSAAVDEAVFKARVDYRYEWKKGDYHLVAPKTSLDIKNEGTALHHCVASYVEKVMDGTTQILFMRPDPEESFITVEVRAGAIVQARGYNNRSVDEDEQKWLEAFAKEKNLTYRGVQRNPEMPTPPCIALVKYDADIAFLREVSELIRS
jgi:hypothetical protein